MKKVFKFLLCAAICLAVSITIITSTQLDVYASAIVFPNSTPYSVSSDRLSITGYNGTGANIYLPDVVIDKNASRWTYIRSVGSSAFRNNTTLESIHIVGSFTTIHDYAFGGCSNLESVVIGDTVKNIGSGVFYGCKKLTSIEAPNGICGYEDGFVFVLLKDGTYEVQCYNGTSINVTIPSIYNDKPVTHLSEYAFYGTDVASITIPNSITSIGNYAFKDCTNLASITIPDSVTSIGMYAFAGCASLESVHFHGTEEEWNAISIGISNTPLINANRTCGHIVSEWLVTLEPTCTETGIKNGNCIYCHEFVEEIIPALGHSYSEWSVALEPTCTQVGRRVHTCALCGECEEEEIPTLAHTPAVDAAVAPTCTQTGLTEGSHCSVCGEVLVAQQIVPALGHTPVIDAAVAPTCTQTGLTEGSHCSVCGEVLTEQQVIPTLGHSFNEDGNCTICGEHSDFQFVLLANNTYEVSDYRGNPTAIEIPATYQGKAVTRIGNSAFSGCSSLVSITIPDSVVEIGSSAFRSCYALTSIFIPHSVESIGASAFWYCTNLESIIINVGTTSIDSKAFNGCTGLTSVYFHGTEEEWNAINIGTQNAPLINAAHIYGHIFDKDSICTICGATSGLTVNTAPTRINYNVGDSISLAGMTVTVVTESGKAVEVNGEDLTLVNTAASLDDPYAYFTYTDENENVYEGKVGLNVAARTMINAYFQISADTTVDSAHTDLRIVSGINDLDHGVVGFILSLDDNSLDDALLYSRAFKKLKWTIVENGSVKLEKAALDGKTYFRISTQTVYNSILAGGIRHTAADLGTKYLFTCNFTRIPNASFNRTFTARSFTVSAYSDTEYDYEYSANVVSHTINEMIG